MDELLSIVQKAIDEKKGERALLYDFHELNPFIDHVVICSAPSVRQTHAIADNIKDRVREKRIRNSDGKETSESAGCWWI